ncbi:MAG: hypothetical protein AAFV72_06190, partial [Cyanobacteria bacterium J06635_1]
LQYNRASSASPALSRDPMPNYRRLYIPGSTVFLIWVTNHRMPIFAKDLVRRWAMPTLRFFTLVNKAEARRLG